MKEFLLALLLKKLDKDTNYKVTEIEKAKVLALALDDNVSVEEADEYIRNLIKKYSSNQENGSSDEEIKQIVNDLYDKNDAVVVGIANGDYTKIAAETSEENLCYIFLSIAESLAEKASDGLKQEVKKHVKRILGE